MEELGIVVSLRYPVNSDFWRHFISSLITISWNSTLSLVRWDLSSPDKPDKASCLSNSWILWSISSFCYVTFPKVDLFQDLKWSFRFFTLLWIRNPIPVSALVALHHDLTFSLNKGWCNHMFPNGKGWGLFFGSSVSKTSRQWSETGRGSSFKDAYGNGTPLGRGKEAVKFATRTCSRIRPRLLDVLNG